MGALENACTGYEQSHSRNEHDDGGNILFKREKHSRTAHDSADGIENADAFFLTEPKVDKTVVDMAAIGGKWRFSVKNSSNNSDCGVKKRECEDGERNKEGQDR